MAGQGEKVKWHCNLCLRKTKHTVLYTITKQDVTETHEASTYSLSATAANTSP